MLLTIAVVLPTKNRPNDLLCAIKSLLLQTQLPDELIVVDQTECSSFESINFLCFNYGFDRLKYIHDPNISGLVHAKQVGVFNSSSQIICFLEDDIVLEQNYISEVHQTFSIDNIGGCCGVVTNDSKKPFAYYSFYHLFHLGFFKDKRVGFLAGEKLLSTDMYESDKLSGGISCWRREIFDEVEFDVVNGFHMLEDIEFSTRVARHFRYKYKFIINPYLRLQHNSSPLNREYLGLRQRRKLREYVMFYKLSRKYQNCSIEFYWLLIGLFIEAIFQTTSQMKFSVLRGFVLGIIDGVSIKPVYRKPIN